MPRDPRWSDPAPDPTVRRVPIAAWKKVTKGLPHAVLDSALHSELRLPSGVVLGVASERATLPDGELVASEDVIVVMSR